jgi:RNA 2',3'-cyclic 3'-phosphodiesterase
MVGLKGTAPGWPRSLHDHSPHAAGVIARKAWWRLELTALAQYTERMRLFIALPVPEEVRARLARAQQHLEAMGLPVRWARPEGLHLTLVFLGEVSEDRIAAIQRAMDEAAMTVGPISLGVAGTGAFPMRGVPRVLWSGFTGDLARLSDLQQRLADRLRAATFEVEDREFRPHVTLGRTKAPWPAEQVQAWRRWATPTSPEFGTWRATDVHLIRSQLHPQGSRYSTVYTSVLGG